MMPKSVERFSDNIMREDSRMMPEPEDGNRG
jgi:hypothetical protein